MKVKIITNSGYKYFGEKISENTIFIEIIDEKEGKIKVPLVNISFMKEVKDGN
jgi:hypothetical protein